MKTKRTLRSVLAAQDVNRDLDKTLARFIIFGVRETAVEERTKPVDEEGIKTLRRLPYYD